MLFNSPGFVFVFLPLAVVGFFALARLGPRAALGGLAAASLFFYGWWNPRLVPLLLASIAFNFAVATRILAAKSGADDARARRWLAAGVIGDLALLGAFKYANFFIATAAAAVGRPFAALDIVLPLGISFFTFTQVAFLVDASRGLVGEVSPLRYLVFVTFFPHLIAGPLYHHSQVMPQFASTATFRPDASNFHAGLVYFAIGLFKKTVIADGLADSADPFFAAATRGEAATAIQAWAGVLAYGFQLYFDFSGYSDMAVGLARLFNVRLPVNFLSPYKATSAIDFWRRWHITLSTFLRDYLYIPLGGNRKGEARRYANLIATMLLGGLWHGAAWTFVVWGGLHGAFLAVNHLWRRAIRRPGGAGGTAGALLGGALTFACVMAAWVPFRADSIATALRIYREMAGAQGWGPGALDGAFLLACAAAIAWGLPNATQYVESLHDGAPRPAGIAPWLGGAAVGAMAFFALKTLARVEVSPFLYFNF